MSEPSPRPPIATAPISVILFAHALSTDVREALRGWREYFDVLKQPYELIVVQETRPEAGPAEELRSARTIPYDRAAGFRDALNEAIRSATHPLLVFCPADKQYDPADLNRMLKVIDRVDMVVGYRKGGQPPLWRVLLDMFLGLGSRFVIGAPLEPRASWLGSEGWGRRWVARWIFGVRVWDPECPFRLARRDLFAHVPIQSGGPFVHVEMLAKANHLTCYLAEELVSWTPPATPMSDAISFGQDARLVFRNPEFGTFQPSPEPPLPT